MSRELIASISLYLGPIFIFIGFIFLINNWIQISDNINLSITIQFWISIILSFFEIVKITNYPSWLFIAGTFFIFAGIIMVMVAKVRLTASKPFLVLVFCLIIIYASIGFLFCLGGYQEFLDKVNRILLLIGSWFYSLDDDFALACLDINFYMLLGVTNIPFMIIGLSLLSISVVFSIIFTIFSYILNREKLVKLEKVDSNEVKKWSELGMALYRNEKLEKAIDCFNKALEIDPNYKKIIDIERVKKRELEIDKFIEPIFSYVCQKCYHEEFNIRLDTKYCVHCNSENLTFNRMRDIKKK